MPEPWRASRTPRTVSARIASRIELREIPSWTARSRSVGSRWPGSRRPSAIIALIRSMARCDTVPFCGAVSSSPFWQSYNDYVPKMAKSEGVDALKTVNSNSDPSQQITDINNQLNQGVKGLVVAPLDSAAIEAGLDQADRKGVPVVAVDVAPDKGKVAMVVRADNVAYGTKACDYLGRHVTSGKVVQIMGDLASVNGRDRSEAFRSCVKQKYPKLKVLEIPAKWESDTAASQLNTLLNANPDIKGIYMQAGGVYLA